jgi:hypothetical protein
VIASYRVSFLCCSFGLNDYLLHNNSILISSNSKALAILSKVALLGMALELKNRDREG